MIIITNNNNHTSSNSSSNRDNSPHPGGRQPLVDGVGGARPGMPGREGAEIELPYSTV